MEAEDIAVGMRVRIWQLYGTGGMFIKQKYLDARKKGMIGVVYGFVPGHGGDVWWVKHENTGEEAAYCFTEMELVSKEESANPVIDNNAINQLEII